MCVFIPKNIPLKNEPEPRRWLWGIRKIKQARSAHTFTTGGYCMRMRHPKTIILECRLPIDIVGLLLRLPKVWL